MSPTLQILYPEVWKEHRPKLRPLIEAALKHARGEWDFESLEALILRGQVLGFASFDGPKPAAVLVGQYVHYPRKTTFLVTFAAGGFRGYENCLARIAEVAKAGGAVSLEATVRPSVARYLQRFGFEAQYYLVQKPI